MRSANGAERRPGVVAAVLGLLMVAAILYPASRPGGLLRDFNAFYCAGQTLQHGADPYRAEPLGGCERTPKPEPLIATGRGLVAPAPLPPYALVPFRLLAQLPYVAASLLWTFVGIIAVGVAVAAMRRLTNLPLTALIAAFALGDGYASLCLGQVAPIAVAAIAVAAMLLAQDRDELAACAAGVAMLEPHVGLPVCASLFFWRSRTRLPLLGIALLCVATSLVAAGFSTSLEYVRDVLPAHALSEIGNEKQFSLTYALHRLHVSDAIALRVGEMWYAAAFFAGIWAAGRLARRSGNPAALAVIPPALAVLGGPFVHIVQIAAALPAALVLYTSSAPRTRRVLGCAIVMLAIPLVQFPNLGTIFIPLAAVTAALLAAAFVDERPLCAAVAACASVGFLSAAIALVVPIPDATPILTAHYDPRALAETSWLLFVRTIGTANATAFDFAKLPTVAALVVLAYATIVAALRPMKTPVPTLAPGGKGAAVSRRIALP
jgi:hypothetical protein